MTRAKQKPAPRKTRTRNVSLGECDEMVVELTEAYNEPSVSEMLRKLIRAGMARARRDGVIEE